MLEYPKQDFMGSVLSCPLSLGGIDINSIKPKCLFLQTSNIGNYEFDRVLAKQFDDYEYVFLHDFFHFNHYHIEKCVDFKRSLPHQNIKIISSTPHRDVYIYDFLWNLTKAYYTKSCDELTAQIPMDNLWAYDRDAYVQPSVLGQGSKIFLSVNRIYKSNTHRIRRAQLVNLLENYEHLGYLGKTFIDDSNSNDDRVLKKSVVIPGQVPDSTGPFNPVHQEIYDDTFLNIYVESLEKGMVAPTEKTYFPLIKGHFILPFSGPYIIKQIRHQGWKLPDFIDYSYDQFENDDDRWIAYTKEVQRLLTFPVSFYKEKVLEHADDLWHNINMVHTKPYQTLLPLLKKII